MNSTLQLTSIPPDLPKGEPHVPKGIPALTCGAKTKSGGVCGRSAGWGTDHNGFGRCTYHGGSSPSGRKAAQRVMAEQALEKAVVTYGLSVDIDPGEALLEEVRRTAGHVRWLEEKVRSLDPDAVTWGPRQSAHQVGYGAEGAVDVTTTTDQAGVNVWVDLYLRERDHLRKVCTDALKAGVRERQVRLAEQAGERAGRWLQVVLADLALSDAQIRAVVDSGMRHLALLQGEAV